jgi:hypothetical protein
MLTEYVREFPYSVLSFLMSENATDPIYMVVV